MAHPVRNNPVRPRRRGFTVIEILIVVGVIILLLSILIVAMNKAVQAAQAANTSNLLNSLQQGLIRFKEDIGYYPPILGGEPPPTTAAAWRTLFPPPDPLPLPAYRDNVQKWFSITSLPDYLIGYGGDQADAFDGLGIRTPGRDGVWGAGLDPDGDGVPGELSERNSTAVFGSAQSAGQVFGPYIELKDDRLLASINGSDSNGDGTPDVYFPGEPGYNVNDPKVIVDYWGTPIRYYRRAYPFGSLGQSYRQPAQDRDGNGSLESFPTLSDVFALRPYIIPDGAAIDGLADDSPLGSGDTSTTYELNAAEFGLLSAGPDKTVNPLIRADLEEVNRDNLVELGP